MGEDYPCCWRTTAERPQLPHESWALDQFLLIWLEPYCSLARNYSSGFWPMLMVFLNFSPSRWSSARLGYSRIPVVSWCKCDSNVFWCARVCVWFVRVIPLFLFNINNAQLSSMFEDKNHCNMTLWNLRKQLHFLVMIRSLCFRGRMKCNSHSHQDGGLILPC